MRWRGALRTGQIPGILLACSESSKPALVDVSDIFYFFFARGGGKGESEAPGAVGCRSLLKFPGGGEFFFFFRGGEGPRGREGVCGELVGGGAKYFFFGPKCPPSRPNAQNSPDRGQFRKIRFSKFPGSGLRNISESVFCCFV